MFGFIKNFFGGILGFFGGIFGGKKSEKDKSIAPKAGKERGYFMTLDESGADRTDNGNKPAPTQSAKVELAQAPKSGSAKNGKAAKGEPAPKPEPIVAAAPAQTAKVKNEPQSATTFAPNLLSLSSTNGRRRPGANMNQFLDMARQVKTSR